MFHKILTILLNRQDLEVYVPQLELYTIELIYVCINSYEQKITFVFLTHRLNCPDMLDSFLENLLGEMAEWSKAADC